MAMTDDDAYDLHREQVAESGVGAWPRRGGWDENGDYARNQRWWAIQELESPWMKRIMTEMWPW